MKKKILYWLAVYVMATIAGSLIGYLALYPSRFPLDFIGVVMLSPIIQLISLFHVFAMFTDSDAIFLGIGHIITLSAMCGYLISGKTFWLWIYGCALLVINWNNINIFWAMMSV